MTDLAAQPQIAITCGLAPDGGTAILERHVEWPWSLPRGYKRGGLAGRLTVLPQCAGAALLPGDYWRHAVTVQEGASVDLISAGALMIHADRKRGGEGRSDWDMVIEPGAVLRYMPDPNVLMPGAKMNQHIKLKLAHGARAVVFDGFCRQSAAPDAGGFWKSDMIVTDDTGKVIVRERQHVTETDLIMFASSLRGMTAFGTVLFLRDVPFTDGPLDLPDCYAAVGPTRGNAGQIVRIAAKTGGALDRAFRHIRSSLT